MQCKLQVYWRLNSVLDSFLQFLSEFPISFFFSHNRRLCNCAMRGRNNCAFSSICFTACLNREIQVKFAIVVGLNFPVFCFHCGRTWFITCIVDFECKLRARKLHSRALSCKLRKLRHSFVGIFLCLFLYYSLLRLIHPLFPPTRHLAFFFQTLSPNDWPQRVLVILKCRIFTIFSVIRWFARCAPKNFCPVDFAEFGRLNTIALLLDFRRALLREFVAILRQFSRSLILCDGSIPFSVLECTTRRDGSEFSQQLAHTIKLQYTGTHQPEIWILAQYYDPESFVLFENHVLMRILIP